MADRATRDSFGEALRDLGETNPKIVTLDADLSVSTKSALFGKSFPERFFQMGIAEANMIGTAAGLSFTGYIPFLCSFGAFLVGRYETIRVSVGYSNANVKLVGTHAGLGIGEDGYTQMGLEDVNVLRGLPGITILQPCDDLSTRAAVRFCVDHHGPVYLRLTRQKLPAFYLESTKFEVGKGTVLWEGNDVALIASGATVAEAMSAARELGSVNPWVIDIHTIKPIDSALIHRLAKTCRSIVTIEDHNVIGGLGSAVAEQLAGSGYAGKFQRLGLQDKYGESGLPHELYEKYGLSAKAIVAAVKRSIS